MEHGDVDILEMDVKVELNFITRLINSPLLPFNFISYAEKLHEILLDYQAKAENVRDSFNLDHVIQRAHEFKELCRKLEETLETKSEALSEKEIVELNGRLMWISRHINPVAHSNAGPSEQMTMETFGATPFPRIAEIIDLANISPSQSHDSKLLTTKLLRQRNIVEEGFYQANALIWETLESLQ